MIARERITLKNPVSVKPSREGVTSANTKKTDVLAWTTRKPSIVTRSSLIATPAPTAAAKINPSSRNDWQGAVGLLTDVNSKQLR